MVYEVISVLKVGDNTAVSIKGDGTNLTNGARVSDENDKIHIVLSIGMTRYFDYKDMRTTTDLLIAGEFESKIISI